MLDALGLTKKDSDGYRLRTDNGQRLVLQVEAVAAMMDYPKQMEMVAQQWRKIGIYGDVKQMERGLAFQRLAANQDQIDVWTNGGTELIYLFPRHCLPVDPTEAHLGVEIAKWYTSNGAQGDGADRSRAEARARAVPLGGRAAGGRSATRRRRRSGRSSSSSSTRSAPSASRRRSSGCASSAAGWATSRAAPASPSTAAPRASRIPRRGTSRRE